MSIITKPPISPDVAEVIGECAEKVENRSLLLDKFVLHKSWPMVMLQNSPEPLKMDDASRWSFIRMAQNGADFLRRERQSLERAANGANASELNREKSRTKADVLAGFEKCTCRKLPGNLSSLKLIQNLQFAQALSQLPGLKTVVYGELQGRLIVNLSDSLIQNAGICLDRNTGIPYIPGSAVKGVSRHVALSRLRSGEWTIREFMCVFGSSEADFKENGELCKFAGDIPEKERTLKGGVDFLSAHPITEPTIVVDISNVHYPEYYKSGKIADLQKESPKPNTFPAVEKGVRYAFCVIANGMGGIDEELFAKTREVLVEAITVSGIGAKTGAGYGWFEDVTADVEAQAARAKAAEEARRLQELEKMQEEERRQAEKAAAQRLAAMSPCERILDEWSRLNEKAIINGRYIAKFSALGEADKRGVVEALQQQGGISADVWAAVKGTWAKDPKKKLRNPKAESDIRGYCKKTLNLGKMP